MAYDQRLLDVNEKRFETYGKPEEKETWKEYLEIFKIVATEKGECVIGTEEPYDILNENIEELKNLVTEGYQISETEKIIC